MRSLSDLSGREYMGLVKRLHCEICCRQLGYTPEPATYCVSDAHHPRTGVGAARKAADKDVIALCKEHHQGGTGVHGLGRKAFEDRYGVTEAQLTESTRARVAQLLLRRV